MIALKTFLLALSLSATMSLGSSSTAAAVGTRAFQPDTLAAISKDSGTTAWQKPKVEEVAVAPTPAVTPPAPAPEPRPSVAPAPVIDPNGCEAQGMRYRADNNECIPNPAPPAPAPQPASAPVQTGGADCQLARSLINQYSWNTDVAYNVMVQESGCNPMAANWNDHHGACVGSFGLFQINCGHGQLYDPAANVARAFAMYQQSGWAPWSFTTCKIVSCY